DAARLEADEEEGDGRVLLKSVHALPPVARLPVKVGEGDAALLQLRLQELQHPDELREDQRLMTFGAERFERLQQQFELRRAAPEGLHREPRVIADLPQAQQAFEHAE